MGSNRSGYTSWMEDAKYSGFIRHQAAQIWPTRSLISLFWSIVLMKPALYSKNKADRIVLKRKWTIRHECNDAMTLQSSRDIFIFILI